MNVKIQKYEESIEYLKIRSDIPFNNLTKIEDLLENLKYFLYRNEKELIDEINLIIEKIDLMINLEDYEDSKSMKSIKYLKSRINKSLYLL